MSKTAMTFAEFVASRQACPDICSAYGSDWETMGLEEPNKSGWLYTMDGTTYFLTQQKDGSYGTMIENDEIYTWTLEAAEVELYLFALDDLNDPVVNQFYAIRNSFNQYDDIPPMVPGFTEDSWGNDVCPKLTLELDGYEATLWLDYRNPESRELGPDGPQFSVAVSTEEDGEVLLNEGFSTIPEGLGLRVLELIYKDWLTKNGFEEGPELDAESLILRDDLSSEQRMWLGNFMSLWNDASPKFIA